jgi:methionine aminotransferase
MINSKLPDVPISIFTIMSKMALDHGAINLSQGFPDFSIDQEIIDHVHRFMKEGNNQYAPMAGVPLLRNVIADVIQQSFGRTVNPETEITITAGATEGLYSVITAFIRPGDEVILFDPSYDSYDPAIRLNGGIPVHINLNFPGFTIDWDKVRSSISSRTRMIIVNTPHNPCGTVLAENDLMELERLALQHNLYVLSDEVYERLIYDGQKHHSVLCYPGLAAQSFAVFSFGKTFHATGWKCGYVVAPEKLTAEVRKAHQFVVFSVNTPVQLAVAEYLKEPDHYQNLGRFYQQKRDFFLDQLKGSSFKPLACQGSYFQIVSYEGISKKPDHLLAEEFTKVNKVASIPVSVFYQDKTDNHLLRFCFAKREDTLAKACEILRKI